MQVRHQLALTNSLSIAGFIVLVWMGVSALRQGAETTARMSDSALNAVDKAHTGQTAFLLADHALSEVRAAPTLQEADARTARFTGDFDRFVAAWSGLTTYLTAPEAREQARQTLAEATEWRRAAGSYLPGGSARTQILIQPDRLQSMSENVSAGIDRLVYGLGAELTRTKAEMAAQTDATSRRYMAIGGISIFLSLMSMVWAFAARTRGLTA